MITFQMRVVAANRVEASPGITTLTLAPVADATLPPTMWPLPRDVADQLDVGDTVQFTVAKADAPVVEG